MDNNFYIGWMPSAPESLGKKLKWIAVCLILFMVIVSILLSTQQRPFSTARFESGTLTTIKGIYRSSPVPSLQVKSETDIFGHRTNITVPLVGYGKFGAKGVIGRIEKEKGVSLDNKEVAFRGTLLYSDGKVLLQVDEHDNAMVSYAATTITPVAASTQSLGTLDLQGEILDPKCFFGVMKPGSGKPHLDCAVRCIEGGMSPILRTSDHSGNAHYFLLLDKNGIPVNDYISHFVGRPVSVKGRGVQMDDWTVLYIDLEGLSAVSSLGWPASISCAK